MYLEGAEECVGFVEIDVELPLASLRQMMLDEGIVLLQYPDPSTTLAPALSDAPTPSDRPQGFRFLFKQAPVTIKQEGKKPIKDCLVPRRAACSVTLRIQEPSISSLSSLSYLSLPVLPAGAVSRGPSPVTVTATPRTPDPVLEIEGWGECFVLFCLVYFILFLFYLFCTLIN